MNITQNKKTMETNNDKVDTSKIGATGEFPQGKLTQDDEGELRAGIAVYKDKIVINFGKPVTWLALDTVQALDLAKMLTEKATEVQSKNEPQGEETI